jgi:hypothetical protein
MVGHRADNAGLTFVDVDIDHGIQTAMDHLVGLGSPWESLEWYASP